MNYEVKEKIGQPTFQKFSKSMPRKGTKTTHRNNKIKTICLPTFI